LTWVSHALQKLNYPKASLINQPYRVGIPIPRHVLNEDCPVNPKTFGEKLRKARMDAALQVKELVELGVMV